jgi:rubrerythrin
MEINEKNYNFNREAFVQANYIGSINFCPFCGAPIGYLGEKDKILKYDANNLNKEALNIIDHAVKLEIFNGDFYKKASLLAKSEKIRDMFNALSKIEYMHAKIHKHIGGFNETPILRNMDYSKYHTDKVLLEMACKREKHAVEYYKKYINKIQDESVREIFEVLSRIEKEHIELTKKGENLS